MASLLCKLTDSSCASVLFLCGWWNGQFSLGIWTGWKLGLQILIYNMNWGGHCMSFAVSGNRIFSPSLSNTSLPWPNEHDFVQQNLSGDVCCVIWSFLTRDVSIKFSSPKALCLCVCVGGGVKFLGMCVVCVCVCMHMHACTHMHGHACMCGVCVFMKSCMHVCICVQCSATVLLPCVPRSHNAVIDWKWVGYTDKNVRLWLAGKCERFSKSPLEAGLLCTTVHKASSLKLRTVCEPSLEYLGGAVEGFSAKTGWSGSLMCSWQHIPL